MIHRDYFIYFSIISMVCWFEGAWGALKGRFTLACCLSVSGLLLFFSFIIGTWIINAKPPLQTMGETRLWYSFFLSFIGFLIYIRWKYSWILLFSILMASVFICINIFKPEIFTVTQSPPLQSGWFAPHVIVYMFAYALLGAAAIMAFLKLASNKFATNNFNFILNNLIYIGLAFLIIGLLFGALWAKEAWGNYWSWDPKETWALITLLSYLVYIHYCKMPGYKKRWALFMIIFSFVLLQMSWWGINYLPSVKTSLHTYSVS